MISGLDPGKNSLCLAFSYCSFTEFAKLVSHLGWTQVKNILIASCLINVINHCQLTATCQSPGLNPGKNSLCAASSRLVMW